MHAPAEFFFGEFRLDLAGERLWRGPVPVALMPKPFAVLHHLVENAGRLVRKQELLDAVWPGEVRSAAVLKTCVCQLRRALGDDAGQSRFIETAHRRGYRFIAQVRRLGALPRPGALLN
jgi:DNA-binding winged helix-turn-helix (wHTH) protein